MAAWRIGGLAGALAAVSMAAAAQEAALPAALVERFAPFDQAAQEGWEATTPAPLLLTAATGKAAAAPMTLEPGSYRIVVLCDCALMDVTLLRPDSTTVPPERSGEQAAMYSLDVTIQGAYLTGVDMDDCAAVRCDVAVKVYRKKKT